MNATCEFITARKKDVLCVPNEAIKENNAGQYVTVLAQGNQVVRPVSTGVVGNDYTEILSGVKEGETVVTAIVQPTTTTAAPASNGPPGGGMRMRF
jgi:hypothetical protein